MNHSPWFVRFKPNEQATFRLFCFPHAGGGTTGYRSWLPTLPTRIELQAVRLPGRESRLREPLNTDLKTVVAEIVRALPTDKPFAFFGHSMGSLLAFETVRMLRKLGRPTPQLLFVSARPAPNLPPADSALHHLPDPLFIERIQQRYDAIPAMVLQSAELLELVRPILRADFTLIETYQYRDQPGIPCPIVALGGLQDTPTQESLAAWRAHTSAEINLHLFPGGHFYLDEHRSTLLQTLLLYLQPQIMA